MSTRTAATKGAKPLSHTELTRAIASHDYVVVNRYTGSGITPFTTRRQARAHAKALNTKFGAQLRVPYVVRHVAVRVLRDHA